MNDATNPFEERFQASLLGLKANSGGKAIGSLLGRACGAERAAGSSDNRWAIDGESVRFHSVNGGKSTFTVNPATEPPRLIVALTEDKAESDKPVRYWLYGLTLEACKQAGRPVKSNSAAGRLAISVGQIQDRVELGYADLPIQYVDVTTVAERDAAMDRIDQMAGEELSTIMGATTREKIRAFVLAGREAAGPAIDPAPSQTEAAGETVDAAPGESEPVQATEPVSAGSGPVPVVDSVTEGDGDEPNDEVAI